MAQVPKASFESSVQRQGFNPTYQRSDFATPEAFGAGVARATQGVGQQVEKVANVLDQHAQFMQQRKNEADGNELFIAADIEAGNVSSAFKSLEGKNAVDAYPKYQQDLEAIRKKYLGTAGNSEVARNFDKDFKRRIGYMIVDGGYYSATQNKKYNVGASEARAKLATQDAAAAPFSDEIFNQSLDTAKKAARAIATEHGWGIEEANIAERAATGQVWEAKLGSLSKTDPFRAKELFEKNRNELDGLTQIKVNDQINQQIIRVGSRIEADRIKNQGFGVDDGLVENIKKLEGYNAKPYADGRQTSSGYGTKAQPGDERLAPDELKKVHESRMMVELGKAAEMVDTFHPNLPAGTRNALISLTYNSGGAWMTSGLGAKIRAGDFQGARMNFGQYIKFEGQDNQGLINRRNTELLWWGGEPMDRSASGEVRLATALEKTSEIAKRQFPDDPANAALYEDTLRSRVTADFSSSKMMVRQAEIANQNIIMAEVLPPEGKAGPTQLEQLSPAAQEAYSRSGAIQQQKVLERLRKNATADVPLTPDRFNKFQETMGQAVTDPAAFSAVDPTSLDIPRTLQAQVFNKQRQMQGKIQDNTQITKAMTWTRDMTNAAGLRKGAPDSAESKQYNQFVGALQNEIMDYQETNKKPPGEEDVRKMASRLLTVTQESSWIPWRNEQKGYEVPDSFKDEWLPKFKERYKREPTPSELKRLYDKAQADGQ